MDELLPIKIYVCYYKQSYGKLGFLFVFGNDKINDVKIIFNLVWLVLKEPNVSQPFSFSFYGLTAHQPDLHHNTL